MSVGPGASEGLLSLWRCGDIQDKGRSLWWCTRTAWWWWCAIRIADVDVDGVQDTFSNKFFQSDFMSVSLRLSFV